MATQRPPVTRQSTQEESPPILNGRSRMSPQRTESSEIFSKCPQLEVAPVSGLGDLAQLRDPNLTQAWRDVQEVKDQRQDGVSQMSFPHFMVKNKLLYRVTEKNTEIFGCPQRLCLEGPVPGILPYTGRRPRANCHPLLLARG